MPERAGACQYSALGLNIFYGMETEMKKTGISVLVLGAMLLCVPQAWAQAPKPRAASRASKMHPSKDKPFEGEWKTCKKNKKTGKMVCASHFFLQQGKQICGVWQELGKNDAVVYSGFLQAHMEPEDFRGQEGADYMAQVDFACSKDGESILFFNRPICENGSGEVVWQRLENKGLVETTYLGVGKCRNRQVVGLMSGLNQYAFCDYTVFDYLHKYRHIYPKKRKELQQLPWMQQCLNGQAPANVVPSD